MKLQKILLLSFVIIVAIPSAHGQSIQSLIPSIPTSPQAEAFKSYGEYAVNPSTGVPDISIPIYEINHHGYKIPLALRYVAKPIKPGYNYDVFGLGWALSVNACVSRSIEYVPDELKDFKIERPGDPAIAPAYFHLCGGDCLSNYNYAHDKFNAVLPDGSSFDFIIDKGYDNNITIQVSDGRQVKISYYAYNGQIESFTIIDENGVKYTFAGADTPFYNPYGSYQSSYVSWLLNRVDLPYSTEPIVFAYDKEITPTPSACEENALKVHQYHKSRTLGDGTREYYDEINVRKPTEAPISGYKMHLLTSISYGANGKSQLLLFYKNDGPQGTCQVDKIQVVENTTLVKEISFTTTIQGDGSNLCYNYPVAFLNNVSIKGTDAAAGILKYDCVNYPKGWLTGIDHWGYLNAGRTDLPNYNIYAGYDAGFIYEATFGGLTQVTKDQYDPSPFYKWKISGPSNSSYDCRAAAGATSEGVLSELHYPTGGYTKFDFENHTFLSSMTDYGSYVHDPQDIWPKDAAAFRIRTITNYSSDGAISGRKNYRYGKTMADIYGPDYASDLSQCGWGVAVAEPNLLTYLDFAFYHESNYPMISPKNMILGLDQNGQLQPFSVPFNTTYPYNFAFAEWGYSFTVSAQNFRKLLNGRPPVVYPEVTIYDGDVDEANKIFPKGKTVYKYDLSGDYQDKDFFEPNKYYGNVLSYESKPYYYNRLAEKTDYIFDATTQKFKLLRKEENTYYPYSSGYLEYEFGANYLPERYALSPTDPFHMGYWPVEGAFFQKLSFLGSSLLNRKVTTEYDERGNSIIRDEGYSYNERAQLNGKTIKTSDGKYLSNTFEYPQTSQSGTSPIIADMVSKNIISPVIATTTTISPNNTPISASKIDYAKFGANQIVMPAKHYELEIKPSGSQYVQRDEVIDYSPNGNPLEVLTKDGVRSAYLWGYDDRYMVAEVKNASAADIAYSSFEDNSKGNWNYSGTVSTPATGTFVPTGKNYYNLTSTTTLDKSVTNGKSYTISYWRDATTPYTITGGTGVVTTGPTVNGWTYFEHKVTATGTSIAISGTGGLDELRLYPADALMATYTYDPLIGITSLTDGNGRTSYYQYDALGRVQVMKDKDGNIVKTFDYKYKQ